MTTELIDLIATRHSLFMRIHFWGAVIASPFATLAALTGLFYVIAPLIDASQHAALDRVIAAGSPKPLDELIASAATDIPLSATLRNVLIKPDADASVRVTFTLPKTDGTSGAAGHAGHSETISATPARPSASTSTSPLWVYVNPYTGIVLGQIHEEDRFIEWAKKLHSTLLIGDGARWMIELAASWLFVMLLSGIYLWWPRSAAQGGTRKSGWRRWHPWVGVSLSAITLVILITGMTWSKYAGPQTRVLRDLLGQASTHMPRDLRSRTHTQINGGEPLPALSWQQVQDIVRTATPHQSLTLTSPTKPDAVWRVRAATVDSPNTSFEVAIDAFTGETLKRLDWNQQTAWGKATAIGIPFHRGEFGGWNQALLALFGAGVLFSLVTGWIMVWKRKRTGLAALPRLQPDAWKRAPWLLWVVTPALMWLMPLLLITIPVVALIEGLLHVSLRRVNQ